MIQSIIPYLRQILLFLFQLKNLDNLYFWRFENFKQLDVNKWQKSTIPLTLFILLRLEILLLWLFWLRIERSMMLLGWKHVSLTFHMKIGILYKPNTVC